jgi:cbb3-type cytochrome oxidase cytochrome c subunit/mono/diheme cytochrome c family protein
VKASSGRALRMAYLVASVGGVLFFIMSIALLAVWPGRVLEQQTRAMAPEHSLTLSLSEQRGRAVYSREGCAYCHTQQVRYLAADVTRFGAPTLAWETRQDYPQLWGTRRIGPDLARVGNTRSEDWHFAHLYAPRRMVPDSVMPAYRSLFDGSPERPRQAARDLVAYLDTLGRAREIAGPEGEAAARTGCACPDDEMQQMAFTAPALNPHPARPRRGGEVPALAPAADLPRGQSLYASNCASCHGSHGEGDGPGGASLRPRPANLAEHEYSLTRLAEVMWLGAPGTAMPAWRDRSIDDLSSIAHVVRAFHVSMEEPPPPAGLVELGARVYAENCVQCHGPSGAGDGPALAELRVAPTSFRRVRPSLAESLRALRNGVDGTQMAPWTDRLNDAELVAVAYHVRGLFDVDRAAAAGAPR